MTDVLITLSPEGDVSLPQDIRDALQWAPGMRLVVEKTHSGVLLRPVEKTAYFPPTKLEDVFGMLKYDGPPVSIEDMHAGIAKEVKRRHDRGRH